MCFLDYGKLITWGSTDDLGQSYVTSGKHGVRHYFGLLLISYFINYVKLTGFSFNWLCKEMPEPFPLPSEVSVVKAAAGWAHCVAVTGTPISSFILPMKLTVTMI